MKANTPIATETLRMVVARLVNRVLMFPSIGVSNLVSSSPRRGRRKQRLATNDVIQSGGGGVPQTCSGACRRRDFCVPDVTDSAGITRRAHVSGCAVTKYDPVLASVHAGRPQTG